MRYVWRVLVPLFGRVWLGLIGGCTLCVRFFVLGDGGSGVCVCLGEGEVVGGCISTKLAVCCVLLFAQTRLTWCPLAVLLGVFLMRLWGYLSGLDRV